MGREVRAQRDRGQMAEGLGGRRGLHHAEPRAGGGGRACSTCSRCCRTPRASSTWGTSGTTRSAMRRPSAPPPRLRVLHPMGYDAFGLPAENAAIRERAHPRLARTQHRAIHRQMQRMGWAIDWTARSRPRTRVLPLDAVVFPPDVRARARVSQGGAGQLVPGRPDGARERAGHRRPLRALWRAVEANTAAVVLQDHRLRRRLLDGWRRWSGWPERVLTMQRNWIGRSEGAGCFPGRQDGE